MRHTSAQTHYQQLVDSGFAFIGARHHSVADSESLHQKVYILQMLTREMWDYILSAVYILCSIYTFQCKDSLSATLC